MVLYSCLFLNLINTEFRRQPDISSLTGSAHRPRPSQSPSFPPMLQVIKRAEPTFPHSAKTWQLKELEKPQPCRHVMARGWAGPA